MDPSEEDVTMLLPSGDETNASRLSWSAIND
jgi:hypothetical protein